MLNLKKSIARKGIVGLDIGSSAVKAVELEGRAGQASLTGLGYEQLPPDTVVDGQIMELNAVSQAVAEVFNANQIRTTRVAANVSGSAVIVKNIVVPKMSEEELDESIDWHAEEYIPFDINDVCLDYQVVGAGADSLFVLMAACKRDYVANRRQAIQLAGKEPIIIDVDAFALQNCYEYNYLPGPDQTVALLNIGAANMTIQIVRGTRSMFTRDASFGGNQYTAALQRDLGLTYEQAESVKRGGPAPDGVDEKQIEAIFAHVTDALALEVQKTFDFYRATTDESERVVEKIYLAGGGSKLRGLAESLAERLHIPVEPLDPFRRVRVDARRFDPDYMREFFPEMVVAVGLALRGVEG
ncbi:MAG: pilus assembly protein PilM [Pyrinomonas sp.]|uniref:type IV pilus assembly protein PilM n=1 Tax=Pyrinomonas sp. TaxID=2080306 RepID=UPI00331E6B83